MKRTGYLLLIFLVATIITGCIETEAEFIFKANEVYDSNISFTADAIMAGDEINMYMWQMRYVFPELNTNYKHKKTAFQRNYSRYVRHTFSITNQPIKRLNDNQHIAFMKNEDGTYRFESQIPKLLGNVPTESQNQVILVVKIVMPGPIDMANTTAVRGNTATWRITKLNFAQGITLKAVTKK